MAALGTDTGSLVGAGLWPYPPYDESRFYDKAAAEGGETVFNVRWLYPKPGHAILECIWASVDGSASKLLPNGFGPWVLDRVVTNPGYDKEPTDNYDLQVLDLYGNDILDGAGMDRDTANVEWFWAALSEAWSGRCLYAPQPLRIDITNAGTGGRGVVAFFFKRP